MLKAATSVVLAGIVFYFTSSILCGFLSLIVISIVILCVTYRMGLPKTRHLPGKCVSHLRNEYNVKAPSSTSKPNNSNVESSNPSSLVSYSAKTIAEKVKSRGVTSTFLVQSYITQIKNLNPYINAMVFDNFSSALQDAKAVDSHIEQIYSASSPSEISSLLSALPPLYGVPCSIKESYQLTGMPNAAGLVSRKGIRSTSDAPPVAQLKKAGAIPLCVTNTSELCMWMESSNSLYGRTNNPYDLHRTCGGSSGGEGAMIGSCGSAFGLGSDIGGSIRMPSFFNGIFGHKPTCGTITNEGEHPPCQGLPNDVMLCKGPMARYAIDLIELLPILAKQSFQYKQPPQSVDISKLNIYISDPRYTAVLRTSAEMKQVLTRISDHFKSTQHDSCKELSLQHLSHSMDIWAATLASEPGPTFLESLSDCGKADRVYPMLEVLKLFFSLPSSHTLPAVGLAILERLQKFTPEERTKNLLAEGARLRKELEEMLGDKGVIILPTFPTVAPIHSWALLPPTNWVYTATWNWTGLPVTSVPMGLNKGGVPLGVQIVGGKGMDHNTLAMALYLEKVFGGWVPPLSQ